MKIKKTYGGFGEVTRKMKGKFVLKMKFGETVG